MATAAAPALQEKMSRNPGKLGMMVFGAALVVGVIYTGVSIARDIGNGSFHLDLPVSSSGSGAIDRARVRIRQRLSRHRQRGGDGNLHAFAGAAHRGGVVGHVQFRRSAGLSGAVAFGIISLLPVELILQVGSGAGFAMVFALLIAAILWNLGTWYLGLPASSSHTMVGSIIGVGIANQLMNPREGTSGVDWGQALKVGKTLLISPLVGFGVAAILLLVCKAVIKDKRLYEAPAGTEPPPFWIRGAAGPDVHGRQLRARLERRAKRHGADHADPGGHGSDGLCAQSRGHGFPDGRFSRLLPADRAVVSKYVKPSAVVGDSRDDLTNYIRTREFNDNTMLALRQYINDVGNEVAGFKQY